MNKQFEQLINESKQVTLTEEEKTHVRGKVLNFMKTHPVRKNIRGRQQRAWSNILTFNYLVRKPMPIFLSIVLLLSGTAGITLASQNSLPGEMLYPIKLRSEDVRSVLALSTQSKAELEVNFAENRLEEAEELSNETKLDTEIRSNLENNFELHANRVEEHAKALALVDAKAAADISANLEASLRAHDRILSRIALVQEGTVKPEVKSLLLKIRSEARSASQNRQEGENEVNVDADVQAAAEGRLNAAENKVNEVKAYITRVQNSIGEEATADAEARLQIAQNLIISGKAKIEAKAYSDAFRLFGQAHQVAQEAKLLLQAKKNLNVDVKFKLDAKSKQEVAVDHDEEDEEQGDDNAGSSQQIRGGGGVKLNLGL